MLNKELNYKRKRKNTIKASSSEKVGKILNYVFLTAISLVFVLPFIYILMVSITSERSLGLHGASFIPKEFSIDAYKFIFTYSERVVLSFRNSTFITAVGTIMALLITAGIAYPMSKKQLPFRTPIMMYIFFSMLFGGGIIPYYILIANYYGLYNSIWVLIIPGAYSTWNMILMRNFFMSLPDSLEESALIDGANELQIMFKIILPLSMPVIATIGLFYAVSFWNSWFGALLFISEPSKWPIMMFLRDIVESTRVADRMMDSSQASYPPSESLKMAVVVVVTAPIIMVYPFIQKYFVRGIMIGSIKG